MNTNGIRRRGYTTEQKEKLVFEYTHTANAEMIPISYDSNTKALEVNQIPEDFNLTTDNYSNIYVHVLNRNTTASKIPVRHTDNYVRAIKIDDTHIMLENTGDDVTTSVPSSGTYALDAFKFEIYKNQAVKLLDRQEALGHRFRVEVTEARGCINKYNNYWLGIAPYSANVHYVGNSYAQGFFVGDFTLEFTVNEDGTVSDLKIPLLYYKRYWHPGVVDTVNKVDLTMTLEGWPQTFNTISLGQCYFNGTNVKVYKIS